VSDAESVMANLGGKLKRLRSGARLTLDVAAQRIGVSKGYLSKVESGHAMPSSKVIIRLATAYGIPLSDLLMPDGEKKPISVVRASERMQVVKSGNDVGYRYELATRSKLNPRSEAFFLDLPVIDSEETPRFRHDGEEIILVLEGRVRFVYAGAELILGKGDCIQFNAGIEHYTLAEGGDPARLFVVSTPDWAKAE
jgi:transcriptional regulator with XRE-family HTH domain